MALTPVFAQHAIEVPEAAHQGGHRIRVDIIPGADSG
jgi:hypothetical protein